jgi:hypothetical protein
MKILIQIIVLFTGFNLESFFQNDAINLYFEYLHFLINELKWPLVLGLGALPFELTEAVHFWYSL